MIELWKDIVGYEKYQVSNFGKIKKKEGKIIKPLSNGNGYFHIILSDNENKRKTIKIHRIVADNFIEKIEGKNVVNHKNGDKTDNRVDNLEWCNKSENELHAYHILGKKSSFLGKKGKLHPNSRKIEELDSNGNVIKVWDSIIDIQRKIGVHKNTVLRHCKGNNTINFFRYAK